MEVNNLQERLLQARQDAGAGIRLAWLTGDARTSVYVLELAAGQHIPAHYHTRGIETYFILSGRGFVSLGEVQGDRAVWQRGRRVKRGDCFTIHPGEVHQLRNLSPRPLRIIATAPRSHSGKDRFFVSAPQPPSSGNGG